MKELLIGLAVIGWIAGTVYAMSWRHKNRCGPTAAIFLDAFWFVWLPIVLNERHLKRIDAKKAEKAAGK